MDTDFDIKKKHSKFMFLYMLNLFIGNKDNVYGKYPSHI